MKCSFTGFTLDDVFLLMYLRSYTGELVLESGNNIGSILLYQGKVLQAFSPYSRAIGDLLVEEGVIGDNELLDTLKIQKSNAYEPLGSLLLKNGKVSFEVIEMMVHEQIRQAVKEFRSWNGLSFSLVQKEIKPFDAINLPLYEFIPSETLKTVIDSIAVMARLKKQQSHTHAPASTAVS